MNKPLVKDQVEKLPLGLKVTRTSYQVEIKPGIFETRYFPNRRERKNTLKGLRYNNRKMTKSRKKNRNNY